MALTQNTAFPVSRRNELDRLRGEKSYIKSTVLVAYDEVIRANC